MGEPCCGVFGGFWIRFKTQLWVVREETKPFFLSHVFLTNLSISRAVPFLMSFLALSPHSWFFAVTSNICVSSLRIPTVCLTIFTRSFGSSQMQPCSPPPMYWDYKCVLPWRAAVDSFLSHPFAQFSMFTFLLSNTVFECSQATLSLLGCRHILFQNFYFSSIKNTTTLALLYRGEKKP